MRAVAGSGMARQLRHRCTLSTKIDAIFCHAAHSARHAAFCLTLCTFQTTSVFRLYISAGRNPTPFPTGRNVAGRTTTLAGIFTGSIARSAKRRYISLSYSEGDFEVFRPAGATRCTDGGVKFGEIWRGGVDFGPLLRAKFHSHRCNDKGIYDPQN